MGRTITVFQGDFAPYFEEITRDVQAYKPDFSIDLSQPQRIISNVENGLSSLLVSSVCKHLDGDARFSQCRVQWQEMKLERK